MVRRFALSVCITIFLIPAVPLFSDETNTKFYAASDTVIVIAARDVLFPQFNSIAARIGAADQNGPVAVSAVSQHLNARQGNTGLSDALNNFSGVNVQTGFGTHDYFTMRGFNSLDNGLIMTDGVSEPEVMIYNLYNVEQVEILKGPGAFLYGGKPLSGSINLASKQPTFSNFCRASAMYGSFNSVYGAVDAGLKTTENLSARINGVFQQSDNYRDDKLNKVYGFNPTLMWNLDRRTRLDAHMEYLNSEYQPDSGLPLMYNFQTGKLDRLADVDRKTSFQTPNDFSDHDVLRFKLNFIRTLNSASFITSKFYFTNLDWKSAGTLINGAYPTMDGSVRVSRSLQSLDDRQTQIGNKTELWTSFKTGGFDHNLLVSFEVSQLTDTFKIDIAPQIPDLNLYNPVETYDEHTHLTWPYQHRNATIKTLAPYILDVIGLTKKANLVVGVRYDWISFTEKNIDADQTFNNISPMIGLNYSPWRHTSFYANAGQAFAPPSSRSDGTLKPETSNQVEIGLKNAWLDDKIHSTLAIYRLDKNDIAIPDKNGFAQQIGSQRATGLELEVQAQMFEHWASIFTYAFTQAEMTEYAESVTIGVDDTGAPVQAIVDRSGNRAAFAPRHILFFWHTRDFGAHFGLGAGVRYVSSQFIAEDNVYEIAGYTTFDAAIYYKMSKMRWQLNLKNITNAEYEMRGFGGYSVIPAAPFTVMGRIEVAL